MNLLRMLKLYASLGAAVRRKKPYTLFDGRDSLIHLYVL